MHVWGSLCDLCVTSVGPLCFAGYLKGILGFGVSGGCPGELRGAPEARATV